MIYVGIDVAKHKHQVAILDDEGGIYRNGFVIMNNRSRFLKLHEILCHIQDETTQKCQVAMEDTFTTSRPLVSY